ncbi:MAG: eL32 family ribosomal protein [Candidatus Pacearchaeota archaeon]
MSRKFLRVDTCRFLRLGKKRRRLQKWRRARGKSNKIRLGRAGYPSAPKVGFKTARKTAGKIKGLIPKVIHNIKELESLSDNEIAIISKRIGARKKLELIKKADELKIKILNIGGKK